MVLLVGVVTGLREVAPPPLLARDPGSDAFLNRDAWLVRIAKLRPKFLNPKKQANMPETLEKRLAALNLRSKFMIDKQLAHP